jgi:hypothetical protein
VPKKTFKKRKLIKTVKKEVMDDVHTVKDRQIMQGMVGIDVVAVAEAEGRLGSAVAAI